jgi:plastocyanin
MGRRIRVATISATALLMLGLWSGQARAGGGCHDGVTQGTGDTIGIVNACFTPTILHVDPGSMVTFANKDPFAHNVTANGWGHFDKLGPGQSFTAWFDGPGTYPFACTIHPGMSGAIVVGDGIAPGAGAALATRALTGAARAPATAEALDGGIGDTVIACAIGLAGGLALGLSFGKLRRRPAGA